MSIAITVEWECSFNGHIHNKHVCNLGKARSPQPNITFKINTILKLTSVKHNLFTVDLPEVVNWETT